jgi:hypothetical protein
MADGTFAVLLVLLSLVDMRQSDAKQTKDALQNHKLLRG